MEAAAPPVTTGSKTMADLFGRAAEIHGEHAFARHKVGEEWRDVSYAEAWEIVREIGLGLIDLGIQRGDRVCILGNTRPEWSFADFGAASAGAVVVPIYQTNSPKECEWVAGNSEAVAVIAEDAEQVAKIVEVRDNLPEPAPHHRDGARGRRRRARSRSTTCASAAAAATPSELQARMDAVTARRPVHVHLHVRHDRAAEGLRPDARQLPLDARHVHVAGRAARRRRGRRHLPVPAAGALVRAADPAARGRPRRHDRLLRRRHAPDHPRDRAGQADLPAVGPAHLREALHARPDPAAGGGDRPDPHGRRQDPRPRGRRRGGARRSCATSSSRSRRRPSSCATCSAAGCARPSAAPRRSRARSSSSSGARACPCSRATA